MMTDASLRCWIVSDGRKGSENHCVGLAEALGLPYQIFTISACQPWKSLSPWLLRTVPLRAFKNLPRDDPWPDLLLTAGRTPAMAALAIKKASGNKTFCIQILKAGIDSRHFDLQIVPAHDQMRGNNVISCIGALHRVDAQKLLSKCAHWQHKFQSLGLPEGPYAGLLVGGSGNGLKISHSSFLTMIEPYIAACEQANLPLIATCSRRTEPAIAQLIEKAITKRKGYYWNGQGDNPIEGIYACCTHLAVTADSISMLSESAARGFGTTWILSLEGRNRKKEMFINQLLAGGFAKIFAGTLDHNSTQTLTTMMDIAAQVRDLLHTKGYNV